MNPILAAATEGLRHHTRRDDDTCSRCIRLLTGGRAYHEPWPCPDYRRYEAMWVEAEGVTG